MPSLPGADHRRSGIVDLITVSLPLIEVYSRPGCHLCEQLVEELLPLIRGKAELQVLDVDSNPEWSKQYGSRIPVVECGGKFVCQYALDSDALLQAIEQPGPVIGAS